MDLLKKEMERKKQAVAAAKKKGGSKYLKASEIRRIEEEQEEESRERKRKYNTESSSAAAKRDEEVEATPTKKRSREEEVDEDKDTSNEQPRDAKNVTKTIPIKDATAADIESLSSEQVMQTLRELGLPIQIFGEQHSHRRQRLREAMENQKNVMAGLSEMEEFKLGSGHGIRNTFLERDKKEANDEQASLQKAVTHDGATKSEAKKSAGKQGKDDKEDDADDDDPHKRIYRFFKGLLSQWEDDLALRPEAVKRTAAGRNETKTLKQCKDYIRPLFKLCKTRRLEPSLMSHILKIVDYCEEGEFVKANDAYIDVAIGRAAWPIGVTMVGIHARSGRAKIESANVAHVMNSELQRKYLTSVKRLMTYYQKKREDVAPSKKVLN